MTSVREKVEAYFTSLNPISKRLMDDITLIKKEQGDKWDVLSPLEQEDVLWKSLVKPEIEEKYGKPPQNSDVEIFPVLRIKPGDKIIVDEDTSAGKPFGSSWRDEHSAPFRWETQSQLNLTFCENEVKKDNPQKDVTDAATASSTATTTATTIPVTTATTTATTITVSVSEPEVSEEKKEEDSKRAPTIKRPEVPPPPVPPHASPVPIRSEKQKQPPVPPHADKNNDMPIYAKVVKRKSTPAGCKTLVISEMKAHKKALQEMKPAVPPRMSLELKISVDDLKVTGEIDTEFIPKTGFDFLDNW